MKLPNLLLLVSSLAAGPLSHAADAQPTHRLRFGIVRADTALNKYVLAEETADLPRRFKDTGFRWGFDITPADAAAPYVCQYVFHLPAPPDQVTGDLAEVNPQKPSTTVTSAKIKVLGGVLTRALWFDPGDPVGEWTVEVFLNERLFRTIKFRVRNE